MFGDATMATDKVRIALVVPLRMPVPHRVVGVTGDVHVTLISLVPELMVRQQKGTTWWVNVYTSVLRHACGTVLIRACALRGTQRAERKETPSNYPTLLLHPN